EATKRENEREEAVAQLTHQIAQMRVERDSLAKTTEEAKRIIAQLEGQVADLHSSKKNGEVTHADTRKMREENERFKERVKVLENNISDLNRMRENLMGELAERNLEAKQLNTRLLRMQSRLSTAEEETAAIGQRMLGLEQAQVVLEGEKDTFIDSVNHLERSLQIAEDARARFEQASVVLEERVANLNREIERLRLENARVSGENDQLVSETERLSEELSHEKQIVNSLEDKTRDLDDAASKVQSLTTQLEETAGKLQRRAEASDAARAEIEQRILVLTEQNRRQVQEAHSRARFLASMSHEMRTPMNAIIGFTSLLLEDPDLQLSERHRRSLERVSRNARELLELINNVLDLSKIEAGRMDVFSEPADLRMLIERAVGVAEPLREGRPIRLTVEADNGLPALRTDRTKLQQILINLLSNALKFTQEGEVKVTAIQPGPETIQISVIDTGIGIAENDIPRVFDEFHQVGSSVRNGKSGTGLGLAITRRLTELIGGAIEVSSKLGQGSRFTLTIPVEIEGRPAPEGDTDAPMTDPERTALVIDSDPASLFLTKKYLAEAGYSVAATDDGKRGIDLAAMAKPSVITVDLDSIEDGLSVIQQIGRVEKGRLVIAISSDGGNAQAVIEKGASVFLLKPIERIQILGLVERRGLSTGVTVLVVDDEPDARDLVVAMIEGCGYQIQTASNGREALQQIARI